MRYGKRTLIIYIIILIFPASLYAGLSGEIAASVGGAYMQKDFLSYDGPGGMFELRGAISLNSVPYLSLCGDISVTGFGIGSLSYNFGSPPYYIPTIRSTNQSLYSGHFGLQIATASRTNVVRPHAAIGAGFYQFRQEDSYGFSLNGIWDSSDDAIRDQSCLGFRFRAGSDFFVYKRFGLTCDIVYDKILGYTEGSSDLDIHLVGFAIGAVWQFGK